MSGVVPTSRETAVPAAAAEPQTARQRVRASTAGALVRACRPRQWIKNLLVLAAPGAAGVLTHAEVPQRLAVTFVSFCALSSATYLLNDLHDREEDRAHERRRTRPIASGEVSTRLAVATAIVLALGGLALQLAVRPALAGVGLAYLLLTGSYTLWWRSVAVADIAAVSGGFVLRALAGGVAVDVTVSRWFLAVTSFGALFLVAGKRYAELRTYESQPPPAAHAGENGGTPAAPTVPLRASLGEYSQRYLRFVIALSATAATVAYCLWAFQRSHQARVSWYELTVIPFVLWLLRYALLIDRGAGESPEELVLGDRFLLTMSAAWIALFVAGVYVFG
jgi:decaprenyl-phosphate phosphoribosyltransferase